MANPTIIGATAEAAIAAALIAESYAVFIPAFSAGGRVDLVFADGCGLHTVQCKTARRVGDALFFRTCSNTNNAPRVYAGEVEFFGVFSPDLGEAFLVPVADMRNRGAHLRLGT